MKSKPSLRIRLTHLQDTIKGAYNTFYTAPEQAYRLLSSALEAEFGSLPPPPEEPPPPKGTEN